MKAFTQIANTDPTPLLELLADDSDIVRRDAAHTIKRVYEKAGMWRRHANVMVSGLLVALKDPVEAVRTSALTVSAIARTCPAPR